MLGISHDNFVSEKSIVESQNTVIKQLINLKKQIISKKVI